MGLTPAVVVVTDGETRASLAAVRSLGRAGYAVHVVSASGRSLAGASRHARADHPLPDPALDAEGWASALESLATKLDGAVVLPTTEISMGSLYAAGLDARIAVVCPPREQYDAAVDKAGLIERATRLGIDVPQTVSLDAPVAIDALPPGLAYPVVMKARRSRFLRDGRWQMGGVGIARDADGLRRLAAEPGMQGGALLQEFVPGGGEAIFALAERGACRALFAHRRLREKPPSGGVSVLRESIEPDAQLLAGSRALLADLGWSGVAMVEYRRAPDGRAVLMEINPRLWGSLQLAIDAGVDFPALMVAARLGRDCPETTARPGVRTRWLLGDLDHLLIALRRSEERAPLGKSRLGLAAAFLRSFFDGSKLEILRGDDPRPFARELRDWTAELLGRGPQPRQLAAPEDATCA